MLVVVIDRLQPISHRHCVRSLSTIACLRFTLSSLSAFRVLFDCGSMAPGFFCGRKDNIFSSDSSDSYSFFRMGFAKIKIVLNITKGVREKPASIDICLTAVSKLLVKLKTRLIASISPLLEKSPSNRVFRPKNRRARAQQPRINDAKYADANK